MPTPNQQDASNVIANPHQTTYSLDTTAQFGEFLYNVNERMGQGAKIGDACDSANQSQSAATRMPEEIGILADKMGVSVGELVGNIMDGANSYYRRNGRPVNADAIHAGVMQGLAVYESNKRVFTGIDTQGLNMTGYACDSISSEASDGLSMQPNRAVVAVIGAISEACPIGAYLPTDIGSNEARLIIAGYTADSSFGAYAAGGSLNGTAQGLPYIGAHRYLQVLDNGGSGGSVVVRQKVLAATPTLPDTGSAAVKLHKARTIVYVNGLPVANDRTSENPGNTTTIAGVFNLAGTEYTAGGSVATQTGTVTLTFNPSLPGNTMVHIKSIINYEDGQEALTPRFGIQAQTYKLFATAGRAAVRFSIDAITQFQNELALDPMSLALLGLRSQHNMERHYDVLRMGEVIAANYADEFDMGWTDQGLQKTRAQIIGDLNTKLVEMSQDMVERTLEFAITHLYVGKKLLGLLASLGEGAWKPSPVKPVPGIYYAGRLFNMYDVYYNPRIVEESGESPILCVGTSTQVARNPVVFGDAVAPMFLPLATGFDFKTQSGYYYRSFSEINPYLPSAEGFARLVVTGMPQ